jgi:hypothetical protein
MSEGEQIRRLYHLAMLTTLEQNMQPRSALWLDPCRRRRMTGSKTLKDSATALRTGVIWTPLEPRCLLEIVRDKRFLEPPQGTDLSAAAGRLPKQGCSRTVRDPSRPVDTSQPASSRPPSVAGREQHAGSRWKATDWQGQTRQYGWPPTPTGPSSRSAGGRSLNCDAANLDTGLENTPPGALTVDHDPATLRLAPTPGRGLLAIDRPTQGLTAGKGNRAVAIIRHGYGMPVDGDRAYGNRRSERSTASMLRLPAPSQVRPSATAVEKVAVIMELWVRADVCGFP